MFCDPTVYTKHTNDKFPNVIARAFKRQLIDSIANPLAWNLINNIRAAMRREANKKCLKQDNFHYFVIIREKKPSKKIREAI